MDLYIDRHLDNPQTVKQWMAWSNQSSQTDVGVERSGAGWRKLDNFVITSAFVRVLGALERFECDVLKALFYYRPFGLLGHTTDNELRQVQGDEVWEEEVENDRDYKKPPLWNWLREAVRSKDQRHNIFQKAFGVQACSKDYIRRRDEWYKKRNQIAHGSHGVEMYLQEYCDADVFVVQSVLSIGTQCQDKHRLVL
jgi:hypothetical protein